MHQIAYGIPKVFRGDAPGLPSRIGKVQRWQPYVYLFSKPIGRINKILTIECQLVSEQDDTSSTPIYGWVIIHGDGWMLGLYQPTGGLKGQVFSLTYEFAAT